MDGTHLMDQDGLFGKLVEKNYFALVRDEAGASTGRNPREAYEPNATINVEADRGVPLSSRFRR